MNGLFSPKSSLLLKKSEIWFQKNKKERKKNSDLFQLSKGQLWWLGEATKESSVNVGGVSRSKQKHMS